MGQFGKLETYDGSDVLVIRYEDLPCRSFSKKCLVSDLPQNYRNKKRTFAGEGKKASLVPLSCIPSTLLNDVLKGAAMISDNLLLMTILML